MSDALTLIVRTATGLVEDVAVGSPGDVLPPDGCETVLRDGKAADAWKRWTRQSDGSYVDPNAPKPPAPADLLAYANRRRSEISEGVGGARGRLVPVTIVSGTYAFPIDATTRAAISAGALQTTLVGGDEYVIPDWLLPSGQFIELDAESIMTVAKAVSADFQALFTRQKKAFAAIAAGTATTTAQVEAILAAPQAATGG